MGSSGRSSHTVLLLAVGKAHTWACGVRVPVVALRLRGVSWLLVPHAQDRDPRGDVGRGLLFQLLGARGSASVERRLRARLSSGLRIAPASLATSVSGT